ncbi:MULTISPECIES: LytR/AlgR family response regulator transcription factor [Fluviicola]|uniref:LytR/AlgR family response regulator transcription factor n=1 Tax=Fluviicola TaxID=332102 RepID=UPI003137A406
MIISCLIIDDEPLAQELIGRYVQNTPFLECVGVCNNAIEALVFMNKNKVDLLFLDIQMPELSGLEFSKNTPKETRIIFTTAFDKYALEGYKVNALDYLLKPFSYNEFYSAALKAKEWFEMHADAGSNKNDGFIFVKSEYKQLRIDLKDIIYFEGLKDYIKIWVKDERKPILTLLSLKLLESELDPKLFMRVHRSFTVSLENIRAVERGAVLMSNGVYITIAEQYKAKFQEFINGKSVS